MARTPGREQSEHPPTLEQIRAALVESRARWDVIRLLEQIPMSLSTIYAVMGGKPVGADTLRFFERWYHDHGRHLDAPPLPTEEDTRAHIEAVRASVAAGSVLDTAKALNVDTDAVNRLLAGSWPRWSVRRKLARWQQQKKQAAECEEHFAKQGRALARRLQRRDEKRDEREARTKERFGTTWVSFPPGSPEAEQFRVPVDPPPGEPEK